MKRGIFLTPGKARPPQAAPPGSPASGRRGRRFELQLHPADIRKRVRYHFFTRRHLVLAGGVAALFLAFVGFAAAVAPPVVTSLLSRSERRSLLSER